jgi:hypothetical protein
MTHPLELAKCKSAEPDLFENEWLFDIGLVVCNDCPVRSWCLNWVDPKRNFYDGIVGGHIWRSGQPVKDPRTNQQDPVLLTYLKTNQTKRSETK